MPYTLKEKTADRRSVPGRRPDGPRRLGQFHGERPDAVAEAARWRWHGRRQAHRGGPADPGHAPASDGDPDLPRAVRRPGDSTAGVRIGLVHRVVSRQEARASRRQRRRLFLHGGADAGRRSRRRRADEPPRHAAARHRRARRVGSAAGSRADRLERTLSQAARRSREGRGKRQEGGGRGAQDRHDTRARARRIRGRVRAPRVRIGDGRARRGTRSRCGSTTSRCG